VAETGCEGDARADWLAYIGREVRQALKAGVPVHGICLYPILDYPGWDDQRHCQAGLLSYVDAAGTRVADGPLAAALVEQQALFAAQRDETPG
jgi:polysaccharide biosynthesis protein PelF